MKTTFNSLQEVANALKNRFSFINDFDVYVTKLKLENGNVVEASMHGGFYRMSYNGRPDGEYFFHEYTTRSNEHESLNDLYIAFEKAMIEKLRWQKYADESYAEDYNKKVAYKYDYSILYEVDYPATFYALYEKDGEEKIIHFGHYDFKWAIGYLNARHYYPKRIIGDWGFMSEERILICEDLTDFVKKYSKQDFLLYHYDDKKDAMDALLLEKLEEEGLKNEFSSIIELRQHLYDLSVEISKNETN